MSDGSDMPAARRGSYGTQMPLEPGLVAAAVLIVTEADTALALKTGDVPVLATPSVVRLAEEATVLAVEDHVSAGTTTVGYRVQLDHLAPTPVGGRVQAEAMLETVEGRRLTFRVSVSDGHGLVAAGRISRVVVDRARFLEKATGT
jgi:fluoroacetyl-CoA thioesterase